MVTFNMFDHHAMYMGDDMEIAMKKYLDNEFSLCRAAEFSGVSIQEMAKYLSQKGIPFFRQTIEEVARDAKEAEMWLRD